MQSSAPKKRFRPGDLAPVTGIYLVRHSPQHRPPHEAVIVRGEQLPACRTCKTRISYEVLRMASHITHDWDFSGPHFAITHRDFANVRRFPRFHIQLPVEVQLGEPSEKGMIRGVTQNISECGMGAIMEGKLGNEQKVVSINVALGRNERPVALRARLRYRNGLQHGFEFIRISDTEKTALRVAIEKQRPLKSS